MLGDQLSDAIRRLGALTSPIVDSFQIELETTFLSLGNRIKESNLLESSSTLANAAVRDHHVIKRLIFATATRQANRNHELCLEIADDAGGPEIWGANSTEFIGKVEWQWQSKAQDEASWTARAACKHGKSCPKTEEPDVFQAVVRRRSNVSRESLIRRIVRGDTT